MDKISKLLARNGINLEITDTSSDGFYVPKIRTMFVNQSLSDEDQKHVVLHELKHALDHSDYAALYKSVVFHIKMESEADQFMINYLIEENEGQYNYSSVMEEFRLPIGWEVYLK